MPPRPVALLLLLCAAVLAGGAASAAALDRDDTLRRINAMRAAGAQCGSQWSPPAPPLRWDDALERAAAVQARDMAVRDLVAHDGSDGSDVGERAERQGYRWSDAAQNAAAGRADAPTTLAQWLASPSHCENLMDPEFRDVGVATEYRAGTRYRWFWVMVLGRRMAGP
ncbi:MAG: CAP domain-containing protein [Burkholderiales bacterium]|nr:CAP domain-containing protein [Burkholderiales bacterium]